MSFSITYTDSLAFTRSHAKPMAAKVATDLKRMQRFYDQPPLMPATPSIPRWPRQLNKKQENRYLFESKE